MYTDNSNANLTSTLFLFLKNKFMNVYKLCDPKSGETRYIGITKHAVQHRLMRHLKDAKKRRRNHEYLSTKDKWLLTLNSEGLLPICELVAGDIPECEAVKLEKELIAQYQRVYEGGCLLNVQVGGFYTSCLMQPWNKGLKGCYSQEFIIRNRKQPHCKPVYRFTKTGELIDKWDSIRRMCEELKLDRRTVMRCLKHENNFVSHKGYMFSHSKTAPQYINKSSLLHGGDHHNAKAIKAFKNNIEMEFPSIKDAGLILGIPASYISAVLTGKQNTSYGYKFMFL